MSTGYDDMVDGIVWKAGNPHGPMPDYLANMDEPNKTRALTALKAMVDKHGTQGSMDIAAGLAQAHRDSLTSEEGAGHE